MQFLKKTLGFIAVLAILPGAFAATSRATATATSRLPTLTTSISGYISSGSSSSTTSTTTQEYIDAYVDCLKGADVCGSNFEECTNKTLFFAKKSQCASTLNTSSSAAITSLYGSNVQTSFANKNSAGEYVYPTDGSILGQMIAGAHISNRYDTSACVRRYTSCLKKDDVCGADFELCTSNTEFKKQKLFCESTLARCQDEGLMELFGTTSTSANPTSGSRIGIMISEGGALAAVNSVATCYKVVDQCILNACAQNPYKCKEGSLHHLVDAAGQTFVDDPAQTSTSYASDMGAVNTSEISAYIKNNCADTIGGNKFCYATFIGNGAMPTNAQIRDEDNKDEIYAEAYSSRMNPSMKAKIDDLVEKFDTKIKKRCQDTIVNCAMRSCGEGSGAACYASAFASGYAQSVTNELTLPSIKQGCEAVVNTDTACKYAAATFQTTVGGLDFLETSLFDDLFTDANNSDANKPDAVGAVAALNAKLATSYNQAALDQMKRQCRNVASGCIKSLCGNDYENCYRNRTDVYSTLTNSDSASFDRSMNKVGGVLDHTIVLGLCIDTVRNSTICEEHLKAEAARSSVGITTSNTWGSGTVAGQWLGAGNLSVATSYDKYQDTDADGNTLCTSSMAGCGSASGICNTTFNNGSTVCTYDKPVMITSAEYKVKQAENTMFSALIGDIEMEAQAKYNAKMTKQQNMCMSSNSGGIMGARDMGSTFMWAKLKNNKVPTNYAVNGLTANQFVASNELYGSFCRIRITLQSDDKNIQDAINKGNNTWSTAYFAAGDAFTCGSWIPGSALEEISNIVAAKKTGTNADGKLKEGQSWGVAGLSVLGALGGGAGGASLFSGIKEKGGLGGLLGKATKKSDDTQSAAKLCDTYVSNYNTATSWATKKEYGNYAIAQAKKIDSKSATVTEAEKALAAMADTAPATNDADKDAKDTAFGKATEAMASLKTWCNTKEAAGEDGDDAEKKKNGAAIAGAVVGGAVLGTTLGIGGAQIMKANNRSAFNSAQQEWLDSVGSKIRCYIGGEEVGMYGDMISTSME